MKDFHEFVKLKKKLHSASYTIILREHMGIRLDDLFFRILDTDP